MDARAAPIALAALLAACTGSLSPGDGTEADAGGGGEPDAGTVPGVDGGPRPDDAGPGADGGPGPVDAGPGVDAGDPGGPPANRFGIGLVGPGSTGDLDLSADLVGPGGHVKLIFAGITRDTTGPSDDWVRAVRESYDRDLVPVIRMAPPWGDRNVRRQSDDGAHLDYTSLAAAYRRVVEGLPLRDGWPLWLEIHNEPNLCYEWECEPGSVSGDWIGYEQVAHEYAAYVRDVADALHAIGDPRIRVMNGGMAPGGTVRCQCGGDGFEAGITSEDFLRAMNEGVPGVFDRLDGFASHSYPAEGAGWGFFVPYDRARTGLMYFERELAVVGRDLPVFMTETGWCSGSSCPDGGGGSRDQVADWTAAAYGDPWLTDSRIRSVMPFMLRDGSWDHFGWVATDGSHYPVYDRIRALRCTSIPGRCP